MNHKLLLFTLFLGFFISSTLVAQDSDLLNKVRANDIQAVNERIAAGADVNMQDDMMGFTPLILAVTANNSEMVKLLISRGADINKKDKTYGFTPLMMALQSNYIPIARWLISEGADIKIKGNNEATALILAAMNSMEMVELLLANGADIKARSDNGSGVMTNCVMGIIRGSVTIELAEFLLEKGAEIDELNTSEYYGGYTPLFWAVDDNNKELVSFLVKNGANVNAISNKGKTPLSLAEEGGYDEIVEVLNASGAK
jgi:ankyrin repeat protein